MTHPDTLQRAAFEAWAASKHIDITRDGFGGYESQWTEGASEGWQAALQPQAAAEPVEWKHDCSALCVNNLRLWVDRCPHCGKPRTETTPPATQAALTAALEALKNSVDTVWEEYTEAERKYAAYDSRRAKLDGMKAMAQAHTDAIAQIEALKGPTP